MIHRTARERLLFEAKDLPRDVLVLDGIRGHAARLEPSPVGPARLIRVLHEGAEVCWTFVLEAGEARPPFYPDDVPLLGDMSSTLMWDDEAGLHVQWMMPSNEAGFAELKGRLASLDLSGAPAGMSELARELPEKTSEERKELLRDFEEREGASMRDWTRKVFGDLMSHGLPADVTAAFEGIVEFHEAAGWTVTEEGSPDGPSRTVRMRHGSTVRVLQAFSLLGITTLGLAQPAGWRSDAVKKGRDDAPSDP